jgi:hypothetical protein
MFAVVGRASQQFKAGIATYFQNLTDREYARPAVGVAIKPEISATPWGQAA